MTLSPSANGSFGFRLAAVILQPVHQLAFNCSFRCMTKFFPWGPVTIMVYKFVRLYAATVAMILYLLIKANGTIGLDSSVLLVHLSLRIHTQSPLTSDLLSFDHRNQTSNCSLTKKNAKICVFVFFFPPKKPDTSYNLGLLTRVPSWTSYKRTVLKNLGTQKQENDDDIIVGVSNQSNTLAQPLLASSQSIDSSHAAELRSLRAI